MSLPQPILIGISPSGSLKVGNTTYQFPAIDGLPGQVLKTAGDGTLTWVTQVSTFSVRDITTSYLAVSDDSFIRYIGIVNGTITLADNVESAGRQLFIENISDYVVTIQPKNTDKISGDTTTIVLSKYNCIYLVSDGLGNWLLI